MRRTLVVLAFLITGPALAQAGGASGIGGSPAETRGGGGRGTTPVTTPPTTTPRNGDASAPKSEANSLTAPPGALGSSEIAPIMGLSPSQRAAQAQAMGISTDESADNGLIGKPVIGADGTALGTIQGISSTGASGLGTITSVEIRSSPSAAVSVSPTQLTANESGQIVANGVSQSALRNRPSAQPGAATSIIGQSVVSRDGVTLGTVQNVIVDGSGRISQVLLRPYNSEGTVAIDSSQLTVANGQLSATRLTAQQFNSLVD